MCPLIQHIDPICRLNGAEPVGDDDASGPQAIQTLGDDLLRWGYREHWSLHTKNTIRGRVTKARAIMRRCFCPPEIVPAPSAMMVCIPMGICSMSCSRPARRAARQASSRVRSTADPMMLEKISPGSSVPFWSTTPSWRRRRRGSSPEASNPSYATAPASGFSKPRRIRSKVLFPLPDGPTIATNSPGSA